MLFADITYSVGGTRGETTLFGEFTKRIREEFQALVDGKFAEIAQREEKHLTEKDIDFLLGHLSEIALRFPVLWFVHRKFCLQKLLVLLVKKAGDNLQAQLPILRRVMKHSDLTRLLSYRICDNQRSFSSPIYTAVRALAARGGEAVLRYALEILYTGNNYALVGLSYSPDEYKPMTSILSVTEKPNFKQQNNPTQYSALSEVLNVLNKTEKTELFRAFFNGLTQGCHHPDKVLGWIAFLYNLSEMQPEVEDRGWTDGLFGNRYQIYGRTPLATLFNAVDETNIESFVIAWFSMHNVIGAMKELCCGRVESLLNSLVRNQECVVRILTEKLNELSDSRRMAIRNRVCEEMRKMQNHYSEKKQIEDYVSMITAMFDRNDN